MSFLSVSAEGNCGICSEKLGGYAVAYENGGEKHPMHHRCLAIRKQAHTDASCPVGCLTIKSIEPISTGLVRASQEGDLELVSKILIHGNYAISFKNNDLEKSCIPFGGFLDLAVTEASMNGHYHVVSRLLESGNISNSSAGSAFRFAAEKGHLETIKVLMNKRYRRWEQIPFKDLKEGLDIAKSKEHQTIVDYLEPRYKERKLFEALSKTSGIISECMDLKPEFLNRMNFSSAETTL